jgi:hypothetical protein
MQSALTVNNDDAAASDADNTNVSSAQREILHDLHRFVAHLQQ